MSEYFSAAECSETFERLRDVALNGGIRVLTQKDCAIAATEIGRLHDRIAALESELAQARAEREQAIAEVECLWVAIQSHCSAATIKAIESELESK